MQYPRIRALREDKDPTQTYMAKLLNVNQRTHSRSESREHKIFLSALCTIANFHGALIYFLLNCTDISKPYPTPK